LGFPGPALLSPFRVERAVSLDDCRPPQTCACGFILLCAWLPFRVLSSLCPPRSCDRSTFLGVRSPSSRRQLLEAFVPVRVPPLTSFASSAFLTPSTLFASRSLVGLFHPTATSRVHSSGVCSPNTAGPPFDVPEPSRRSKSHSVDVATDAELPSVALRALRCVRIRREPYGV
jgi:hypothetical protein